jgi:spore coat protein CotH
MVACQDMAEFREPRVDPWAFQDSGVWVALEEWEEWAALEAPPSGGCCMIQSRIIVPRQAEYIRNFIDTVELLIQSDRYQDPINGYTKYLDVPSFVDYFIHTELSMNADGYKKSAYFFKDRQQADGSGGKLHAGPVWDYNIAYGGCNFCNGNAPDAWVYKGCNTLPVPAFWRRLTEDPAFKKAVKQRYRELRKTILSDQHIRAFIEQYATLLKEPQERHFRKWNRLLNSQDPAVAMFSAYRVSDYAQEIETNRNWITRGFS